MVVLSTVEVSDIGVFGVQDGTHVLGIAWGDGQTETGLWCVVW